MMFRALLVATCLSAVVAPRPVAACERISETAMYSYMWGLPGQKIQLDGSTSKAPDDTNCRARVQLEMWINPGGADNLVGETTNAIVSHEVTRTGGYYGFWSGTTKHWYIYPGTFYGENYEDLGHPTHSIDLGDPMAYNNPCPPPYVWNGSGCQWMSPILINLKNNGSYDLTSVTDGVTFDIDADGVLEQVAGPGLIPTPASWCWIEIIMGSLTTDPRCSGQQLERATGNLPSMGSMRCSISMADPR